MLCRVAEITRRFVFSRCREQKVGSRSSYWKSLHFEQQNTKVSFRVLLKNSLPQCRSSCLHSERGDVRGQFKVFKVPHFLQLKCFMFHRRLPGNKQALLSKQRSPACLACCLHPPVNTLCIHSLTTLINWYSSVVWEVRQHPLWHHIVAISKTPPF